MMYRIFGGHGIADVLFDFDQRDGPHVIEEGFLDRSSGVLVEHADRWAEVVQRIAELGPDELVQRKNLLRRACGMQQVGDLGPDAQFKGNDRDAEAQFVDKRGRLASRG